MPRCHFTRPVLALLVLLSAHGAHAQTDRSQPPSVLARGLVEVGIGHIDFPFSQAELEAGQTVESVAVPNLALRLSLGYRLNDHFAAQLSYMRPAKWVNYHNINGDLTTHTVWMNILGATLKSRVPLWGRLSGLGEAGLALVTRHGIELDGVTVLSDSVHATPLVGAGLEYALTRDWALATGATYAAARTEPRQPHTVFYSGGLVWKFTPDEIVAGAVETGGNAPFPTHVVQVGYTTNSMGYRLNSAVKPIFWQGEIEVGTGLTLHYLHNIFHTRRLFSLDWGASVASQQSVLNGERFVTASLFPVLKLTPLRSDPVDVYVMYSLAGPTFISKKLLDDSDVGGHFTLQDQIGFGLFTGGNKQFNVEFRVGHFSNGNLLPRNTGIKVPLTISIGYAIK